MDSLIHEIISQSEACAGCPIWIDPSVVAHDSYESIYHQYQHGNSLLYYNENSRKMITLSSLQKDSVELYATVSEYKCIESMMLVKNIITEITSAACIHSTLISISKRMTKKGVIVNHHHPAKYSYEAYYDAVDVFRKCYSSSVSFSHCAISNLTHITHQIHDEKSQMLISVCGTHYANRARA